MEKDSWIFLPQGKRKFEYFFLSDFNTARSTGCDAAMVTCPLVHVKEKTQSQRYDCFVLFGKGQTVRKRYDLSW